MIWFCHQARVTTTVHLANVGSPPPMHIVRSARLALARYIATDGMLTFIIKYQTEFSMLHVKVFNFNASQFRTGEHMSTATSVSAV